MLLINVFDFCCCFFLKFHKVLIFFKGFFPMAYGSGLRVHPSPPPLLNFSVTKAAQEAEKCKMVFLVSVKSQYKSGIYYSPPPFLWVAPLFLSFTDLHKFFDEFVIYLPFYPRLTETNIINVVPQLLPENYVILKIKKCQVTLAGLNLLPSNYGQPDRKTSGKKFFYRFQNDIIFVTFFQLT